MFPYLSTCSVLPVNFLTFDLTGDPTPDVEWMRNKKPLKMSKKDKRLKIDWNVADDMNVLELTKATPDDSGEYSVKATNKWGVVTATVSVVVSDKPVMSPAPEADPSPKFEILPEPAAIAEGDILRLACKATGLLMILLHFCSET